MASASPEPLIVYHRKQYTKSVEWQHVEVQYLNNSREIHDADSASGKVFASRPRSGTIVRPSSESLQGLQTKSAGLK
jgi:hypothetical protein